MSEKFGGTTVKKSAYWVFLLQVSLGTLYCLVVEELIPWLLGLMGLKKLLSQPTLLVPNIWELTYQPQSPLLSRAEPLANSRLVRLACIHGTPRITCVPCAQIIKTQ